MCLPTENDIPSNATTQKNNLENRKSYYFQYQNGILENRGNFPFFLMEKKLENRAYIYVVVSNTLTHCLQDRAYSLALSQTNASTSALPFFNKKIKKRLTITAFLVVIKHIFFCSSYAYFGIITVDKNVEVTYERDTDYKI